MLDKFQIIASLDLTSSFDHSLPFVKTWVRYRKINLAQHSFKMFCVTFQGGFNADCVTEPSRCENGFTVTFWLKVQGTGYIFSSGSFTNKRNGPGYQLYYHQSLKRFKFILETRDKKWTLFIHEEVGLWTHMAFTWRERNGLAYYEDGNLSSFTDKPEIVSALRQQNYTPVITLARPSSSLSLKKFGKFEISQFAIWQKELSAADIAGVYQDGVTYDAKLSMCCYFKSGGYQM